MPVYVLPNGATWDSSAVDGETWTVTGTNVALAGVPSITLKGLDPYYVKAGRAWLEPGYEALDGNGDPTTATVDTTTYVDLDTPGSGVVRYTVTDGPVSVYADRTVYVLADTVPTARTDLATYLLDGLRGLGYNRFNVYPYPADNPKAPAILIVPADPYVLSATLGSGLHWGFELVAIQPRTDVQKALTNLEALILDVWTLLTGTRWLISEASKPDTEQYGGTDYLATRLVVAAPIQR